MRRNRFVGGMLAGAVLALTSAAWADDTHAGSSPAPVPSKDGYSYVFDVDPLQAGALTPNDPLIRIATHGIRQTLIRPRTAFVPELLKTVETL